VCVSVCWGLDKVHTHFDWCQGMHTCACLCIVIHERRAHCHCCEAIRACACLCGMFVCLRLCMYLLLFVFVLQQGACSQ